VAESLPLPCTGIMRAPFLAESRPWRSHSILETVLFLLPLAAPSAEALPPPAPGEDGRWPAVTAAWGHGLPRSRFTVTTVFTSLHLYSPIVKAQELVVRSITAIAAQQGATIRDTRQAFLYGSIGDEDIHIPESVLQIGGVIQFRMMMCSI
jgi:hypothetical protein